MNLHLQSPVETPTRKDDLRGLEGRRFFSSWRKQWARLSQSFCFHLGYRFDKTPEDHLVEELMMEMTPRGADPDPPPQRRKPDGDPDSSGNGDGHGHRGRKPVSMSSNKWAKPIPRPEVTPRVHLQKASEIKKIWELWSMNVALAMSTWSDVTVIFWHQVDHQSDSGNQDWRRFSMTKRFAYEKRCRVLFSYRTRLKWSVPSKG